MAVPTRPFLVVYVVWHPAFAEGVGIAKALFDHFRRKLYDNVTGGTGVPVVYRSASAAGSDMPPDIDLNESETSAIVMLIDERWTSDPRWLAWQNDLANRTDVAGLGARVFPVAIHSSALLTGLSEQAIRWDRLTNEIAWTKERQLISTLTYQFCRMLRTYLERLKQPFKEEDELLHYLKKVEIFLSHSKHDENGERLAKRIRQALLERETFDAFFDVHDIPAGVRFNKVILQKVKVSAVVAIHTDSYSSREWCRREIIEAKRWQVPLVVANCLSDFDERGFPYMGNVPVVRMDPIAADKVDHIIGRLLDEVLKDFLWRCWVQLVGPVPGGVVFLPRPPELIALVSLAGHADSDAALVYPDPPIGAEEQQLFEIVAPKVQLRSMTEWIARDSA